MRNTIVQQILDEYDRKKMGQKLHEDYENLMDKLRNELKKELQTTKINVTIEVPDNWESRLDQQPIIEQQIKDDKWSWNFIPEKTSAIELERVFLSKGCSSLVSFIEGARYIENKFYKKS